jgi:hypothetical protein
MTPHPPLRQLREVIARRASFMLLPVPAITATVREIRTQALKDPLNAERIETACAKILGALGRQNLDTLTVRDVDALLTYQATMPRAS